MAQQPTSPHRGEVNIRGTCRFSSRPGLAPGCVATGDTPEQVETRMKGAIAMHLDGLRADGELVPVASSRVAYVDIAA